MEKLKIFVFGVMILGLLSSCDGVMGDGSLQGGGVQIRGAILPHHDLVGDYIDRFYGEIAEDGDGIERIILLSTNHFDLGRHYIQSTYDLDSEVELDKEFIDGLEDAGVLGVDDVGFGVEHGIMVHMDRIEQYFPEAEVVPIMIKWKTPQEQLDKLVKGILDVSGAGDAGDGDGLDSTLVIASVDFSHFVSEETAVANDDRTAEWFENWGNTKFEDGESETSLDDFWELEASISMDTETSTALDSPESLYVFTKLMGESLGVEIWERTSSLSLNGGKDPMDNTSHLFVKVR